MTPWEILRNPVAPPFNAGVQIRLEDFTADEARALLPGLAPLGDAGPILDEVMRWTSGHPYLTQRVCAALVAAGSRDVAGVVDATLLQQHGDPLFAYTETAFDLYAGGPAGVPLVDLYGRLLGGERVAPDASSREQLELRVTGMAAERDAAGGRAIAVRNRIYARHFDDAWLKRRRMHRFLAAAVSHWRESRRTRGLLGRGDLDDVVEWASAQPSVSGEDVAFLVASQQAVDGQRRVVRGNLLIAGLAASLALLLATVWLGMAQRRATSDLAAQGRTITSLTQHIDELKAQQRNELDSLKAQLAVAQQLADSRKQLNESIQASLDKFNTSLVLLEQEKATLQVRSKRNIDDLRQQLVAAEGAARLAASDSEVLQRQAQTSAAAAARAKTDADAATRQATAAADQARRAEEARASLEQQLQQVRLAVDAMEARARVAEGARTSAETALGASQSQLTAAQNQLAALQAAVNSYCQKLTSPPKPPC
jgi:hypothetical protein